MDGRLFSGLCVACLTCLIPDFAQAQMFTGLPPGSNCVLIRPRAVMSTQYQTQQVMSYRDVAETSVCQKQVVESVPITTCKNVTVDEGGYQMVWVPKPVTRQVAQTVIQQQVRTVSVPVQTVRRVPQISTQVVPVQTVRYVQETVPLQMTAFAGSCSTCGQTIGSTMMTPQISSSILAPQANYGASPTIPMPYPAASNTTAAIPSMPPIMIPSNQTALAPTPGMTQETVPSRSVPEPYETVPARSVPSSGNDSVVPPRKTSMFQRVPSAATVWQSQSTVR